MKQGLPLNFPKETKNPKNWYFLSGFQKIPQNAAVAR